MYLIAIKRIHTLRPFFTVFFVLDLFPLAIVAIDFKQFFAKLFIYSENIEPMDPTFNEYIEPSC